MRSQRLNALLVSSLTISLAALAGCGTDPARPVLVLQSNVYSPPSTVTATGGAPLQPATGGVLALSPTGGVQATGGAPAVAGTGEWCDALAVFRTSCQLCHGTSLVGGAPMSLATYEDTQGISVLDGTTPILQRISERIHDAIRPMPPTSQDPLTPEQMAAIDSWIAAGAPTSADPTCGGQPEPPPTTGDFTWPADCEEFFSFTPSTASGASGPYTVPADTEQYVDFYYDVPWGGNGAVQALGYQPITDNARVLHHWILYQGDNFLEGWAPGGKPGQSPDGVGMYMPQTGQLKMTTHYYNKGNSQAEPDDSGIELCITRTLRPNTSAVFPFVAPATAPANQQVTNTDTCTVHLTNGSQPVFLLSSSPHMHQLGIAAKLEVLRSNGTIDVLHDKAFSFEDQVSVALDPPVQLNEGDQVRTTCVYQNNTSQTVNFGEGSYDEMCFNFASYYPSCGFTCTPQDFFSAAIQSSQGGGCPSN